MTPPTARDLALKCLGVIPENEDELTRRGLAEVNRIERALIDYRNAALEEAIDKIWNMPGVANKHYFCSGIRSLKAKEALAKTKGRE